MKYPDTLPWEVRQLKGWLGESIVSHDSSYPIFIAVKPKEYYTDFPTRTDAEGEEWTVCSTEAAINAGNYVATKEIKAQIEADEKTRLQYIVTAANLLPEFVSILKEILEDEQEMEYSLGSELFLKAKELLAKVKT